MPILGDFHTHTVYSHGKGTVKENVDAALAQGLRALAITDHGFRHMLYHVRRSEFPKQRADIDEQIRLHPNLRIYHGLETNLQGLDGRIDIKDEDLDKLDLIICGYHCMAVAPTPASFFQFWLPNFVRSRNKRPSSAARRVKNTDAFLKAMNRYPIDILSHPHYRIDVDAVEIAKEAARHGTFFELNGKHVSLTDSELEKIVETGVGLIVDSDAHSPDRVGDVSVPMAVVERLHIPSERIVNFDRLPVFRSCRERELARIGLAQK